MILMLFSFHSQLIIRFTTPTFHSKEIGGRVGGMLDGFAKFTLARLVGHLWLGEGGEGWGFGKGEGRGAEMKK
jgi:hypothetical protein